MTLIDVFAVSLGVFVAAAAGATIIVLSAVVKAPWKS